MKRLLVCLSLSGCAHVGVTQLKEAPRKAEGCKLEVFTAEKEVQKPYEVVCLVDARTGTTSFAERSIAGALDEARPAACACGGDAMLIVDSRQEGMTLATNGQGFVTVKVLKFK